jgi:hypothetical protein
MLCLMRLPSLPRIRLPHFYLLSSLLKVNLLLHLFLHHCYRLSYYLLLPCLTRSLTHLLFPHCQPRPLPQVPYQSPSLLPAAHPFLIHYFQSLLPIPHPLPLPLSSLPYLRLPLILFVPMLPILSPCQQSILFLPFHSHPLL